MPRFTFVHAADLHLDSPFKGVTSDNPTVADSLRQATFTAFDNLIRLCVERKVDFLIVAGDVYDGADRSIRAQLTFRDGLQKLADHTIHAFVAHGNHDPLDGWSSALARPTNTHVFGDHRPETFPLDLHGRPAAAITGISYKSKSENRNLAKTFAPTESERFQIAVLHCNCGANASYENYAPCTPRELTQSGFQYWALGHVHERQVLSDNPYVVYPGNTQGRSIRELGERGCYLVTVDEFHQISLEFVRLDAVVWNVRDVPIDGLETIDALDRRLTETVDAIREKNERRPELCRMALTGRGPLSAELRRERTLPDLLERVQQYGLAADPFVWTQELELACQPEADLELRRQTRDFLSHLLAEAETLRQQLDDREHDPDVARANIDTIFGELYEDRRAGKLLEPLAAAELRRIIRDAELLCYDRFTAKE